MGFFNVHWAEIWGGRFDRVFAQKSAETLCVSCKSKTPRILEVAVGNYVGYIWCPDLDIHAMYWQRHLIWHKQGNMPVI